ncbi:hypothetical protein SNSL254_A4673 [Salmonella enterica subsp. enterica serovar Newport str. SL254]|uniref:Uncharacterized protein n=1 Tax=Salmonella newport (strain SL254) TaxID=423368 RepID=A0A0H3BNL2_SALNS|nr:hypothetical protein SNSL254_A4673 [Salmonella enterica subsp. enterica serovar Newport str. SL254]AGS27618.1 hypothetical protein SN31241_6440 [Salmonella enterica subsp. enterica serovar Newport str. USMARC-S3124.1]QDQ34329.1 hypothetical protein FORC098_4454 [Salmonella enterica subsp. enterica serovar Typhimurium]
MHPLIPYVMEIYLNISFFEKILTLWCLYYNNEPDKVIFNDVM